MAEEKKKKKNHRIKLTLNTPIEYGEELIEYLEFYKPTAGDIENLGSDAKLKDILQVAARCTRHPYSVIRKLDAQDALRAAEVVGDFLESGPAITSLS